jgi:general secretion pathway protein E
MVCKQCAAPVDYTHQQFSHMRIPEGSRLVRGVGCGACRGTGYKGRKAIAEVLRLDDELRELISNRGSIREIKVLAQRNGTQLLHDVALQAALDGLTTIEEVQRVAPRV